MPLPLTIQQYTVLKKQKQIDKAYHLSVIAQLLSQPKVYSEGTGKYSKQSGKKRGSQTLTVLYGIGHLLLVFCSLHVGAWIHASISERKIGTMSTFLFTLL